MAVVHEQEMELFRSLTKDGRSIKKPEEDLSHLNAFTPHIRRKLPEKYCSVMRGAATKGARETLFSISSVPEI